MQTLYVGDASAVGGLSDLFTTWKSLLTQGPKYGYFPYPTKTQLVVKDDLMESATSIFGNTGISIMSSGRRVLGSPIGYQEFIHHFVFDKVTK